MIRRALTVVVLIAIACASLQAELKYTMKMEARDAATPPAAPANPMLAMIGGMVLNTMAPPGGVESTVIVGERGTRTEYNKAYAMVPAGGAMITMPDGSSVVLDPAKKTYFKISSAAAMPMMGQVKATVARTGEFATVAGVRAERAKLDIRMPLPVPPGMAGFPTELSISGDAWLAEQYTKYAAVSKSMASTMGAMGLEQMMAIGLPVRSIMRSELFGGKEVESIVTAIAEVTVPASTFEIPAGFTEVPAPMPAMPMPMPGRGR